MDRIPALVAFFLLAILLVGSVPASACPNCKNALEEESAELAKEDGQGGDPARGYFWSILAMLAILGLLATGFIRMVVRASQEATIEVPAVDGDRAT